MLCSIGLYFKVETDPDVLSLPDIYQVCQAINLWIPGPLSASAQLNMKRAVISCLDSIGDKANRLDVEDIVAQAADSAPVNGNSLNFLSSCLCLVFVFFCLLLFIVYSSYDDYSLCMFVFIFVDIAVKLLRQGLNKITKEFEDMIEMEREKVKRLGGLYVIGTSRHESRRIDNQLRGRAGRQGDPGGTRFFLSLEDDIFKVNYR